MSRWIDRLGVALACALAACSAGPESARDLPIARGEGEAGASAEGACDGCADSPSGPAPAGRPAPPPPPPPMAGNAAVDFEEPPPPRTGVIFEWPETDPSVVENCRPGRYVGEYSCRLFIITTDGDGAFDVSGTIDMRLEQSAGGELLRIADGRFESATLAAIPMSAEIIGELDCSASRFEGRLENGIFSVALGLPIPFTEGTFEGPLSSDYDPATAELRGTWNMMGMLAFFPGTCMNGSWSARWVE